MKADFIKIALQIIITPQNKESRKKRPILSQRFSGNVWIGVIANILIGSYFLPYNLNTEFYEHFLEEEMVDLLENVPQEMRENMYYYHDDCFTYYRVTVRQ